MLIRLFLGMLSYSACISAAFLLSGCSSSPGSCACSSDGASSFENDRKIGISYYFRQENGAISHLPDYALVTLKDGVDHEGFPEGTELFSFSFKGDTLTMNSLIEGHASNEGATIEAIDTSLSFNGFEIADLHGEFADICSARISFSDDVGPVDSDTPPIDTQERIRVYKDMVFIDLRGIYFTESDSITVKFIFCESGFCP